MGPVVGELLKLLIAIRPGSLFYGIVFARSNPFSDADQQRAT